MGRWAHLLADLEAEVIEERVVLRLAGRLACVLRAAFLLGLRFGGELVPELAGDLVLGHGWAGGKTLRVSAALCCLCRAGT